ncbi:MAG: hypothetical protein QMD09_09580 [Desulfatibacillaceae bacterium]|nr:hypothetical protein [Desulfatibacillaceae bacterium]
MQKLAYMLLVLLAFASIGHAGSMALMDDDDLAQVEGRWGMTISFSALDAYAASYGINDFDGAGSAAIRRVEAPLTGTQVQDLRAWLNFSSMRFAGRISGATNASIYSGNANGTWTHLAGGMQVSGLAINMGRVNNTAGYSFMAISIPTMIGALAVQDVRLGYNLSNTTTGGYSQFGFFVQDLVPYANTALYIFPQP